MPELNREDIIKALECCSKHPMRCAKCPYQVVSCCTNEHRKDALTLIKQLTEENERLKADVVPRSEVEKVKQEVLREVFEKLGVYISQEVTIDLKEEAENYRQVIKEFAEIEINRAKHEVVREIFEEIEKIISKNTQYDIKYGQLMVSGYNGRQIARFIDDLKKKYI